MAQCPLTVQLKLEDQIPFVDAEGSCDGSISSQGTGSILGHSTTSEEFLDRSSRERLWKSHTDDRHSLNNILDTVSSSQTRLTDADYSVDKLEGCLIDDCSLEMELPTITVDEPDSTPCKDVNSTRPTTLHLQKGGYVTLSSAYTSLSQQVKIKTNYSVAFLVTDPFL